MIKATLLLALAATMPISVFAERTLDTKNAKKLEVRHSMIGVRSTLLFYTFSDQQAILTVLIDNQDKTFPVAARVYLFSKTTTDEELGKWVNNQYSDGLFVDPPTPEHNLELPQEVVKVAAHKKIGESASQGPVDGIFEDYEVTLIVNDYAGDSKFKLTGFNDTAKVHVKKQ